MLNTHRSTQQQSVTFFIFYYVLSASRTSCAVHCHFLRRFTVVELVWKVKTGAGRICLATDALTRTASLRVALVFFDISHANDVLNRSLMRFPCSRCPRTPPKPRLVSYAFVLALCRFSPYASYTFHYFCLVQLSLRHLVVLISHDAD